MNQPAFDPTPAARRLATAWKAGEQIVALPESERPGSIPEGYAVQAALRQELGEPLAGYKLGMSSPAGMKTTGLGRPAYGFMTPSRIYESGVTLPAARNGSLLFELEVCFILGETLTGKAPTDVLSAMSEARLGIEVICSRFVDRVAAGLPSFLGDDIGFRAYVLGDRIDRSAWPYAFGDRAEFFRDGSAIAPNLTGDARTDPVQAMSMFVADAAAAGLPLEKGMLVTTGSLIVPYPNNNPGHYEGQLGDLRVRLAVDAA